MNLPEKDAKGRYPSQSEGYPLVYFDANDLALCSDCASIDDEYTAPTVACDVHWEGEDIQCGDCNKAIQSAYGPCED